ncbi:MAG: hypothetical protein GEU26_06860 [Nitrososphaeraceae archaeon]|nr:hypothetical protein [Nitrososphaeraceae archaeon]
MSKKRAKTFTVIGIIVALASAGIYLASISSSQIQEEKQFLENYYSLVNATNGVTETYHKEIEKWERDQYDDRELVTITDSFLPQYDLLVDRASGFKPPQKYHEALDLYIRSLRSERESYAMFRDFLETGDPKLNEISIDLLSNSTKYELESFNLINALR